MQVKGLMSHEGFDLLLKTIETKSKTAWTENFIANMRKNFNQYGVEMFLTENQLHLLNNLAGTNYE